MPANPVPDCGQVDIMMTHGPPYQRLDKTWSGEAVGCPHLLRAVERSRPLLHCFGHIHEGWGAERVRWQDRRETQAIARSSDEVKPQDSIAQLTKWKTDPLQMLADRAAYADVSSTSSNPLKARTETLFVNASIMNVRYQPVNAPWLVDLDLPCA